MAAKYMLPPAAQLKVVEDSHPGTGVSTVDNPKQQPPTDKSKQEAGSFTKPCQNCGRKHDLRRREYCPAFGKTCNKCQKRNHFAAKCRSKTSPGVNPVAVSGEAKGNEKDKEAHSGGNVDDSRLVTLRLALSSHIRFQAITEMPPPTDVAGVQCLLGMAQYLSKFLPHLSDLTKPLRDLTLKETEWVWDHPQQDAFNTLKKAVVSTPILRYYNLQEEVTLQCDASQSGLGAALMQNGQPVAYASRALTPTETRYAQIEKELLAIVFACDRFEAYVYGRREVNVESDHQPLEMIVKKPLSSAPKRLQRMLLQLQKYNLVVRYKRGSHMYLADTLSRAYLTETQCCTAAVECADIDHTSTLALPPERVQQFEHASADDPVLTELHQTIQQGWPASKAEVPNALRPYYDFRDELTTEGRLVFKGPLIVVPAALRKEMMAACHETHIGLEGCVRRARESLFWPRMVTELKEYISKCDVCLTHRATPQKETLKIHEFTPRPWSKVGVDLCDLHGRTFLVVCDYFSNFIEVERLQITTSRAVCKALKVLFARYGVPDVLVSDNGPQFASAEFATFAKKWSFEHKTSSPRYPQSNRKAENAVKTVKRLFNKCRETGQSEFQALLDWRNTPTEGVGTSPAQRFLGRRCKTLLPMTQSQLTPQYKTDDSARALLRQKAKHLPPIPAGDGVRMQLPGEKTWTPGVCTGSRGPRSYGVCVGEQEFRRNRRQLLHTQETVNPDVEMQSDRPAAEEPQPDQAVPPPDAMAPPTVSPEPQQQPLRRSERSRKPPKWITNYVPS